MYFVLPYFPSMILFIFYKVWYRISVLEHSAISRFDIGNRLYDLRFGASFHFVLFRSSVAVDVVELERWHLSNGMVQTFTHHSTVCAAHDDSFTATLLHQRLRYHKMWFAQLCPRKTLPTTRQRLWIYTFCIFRCWNRYIPVWWYTVASIEFYCLVSVVSSGRGIYFQING